MEKTVFCKAPLNLIAYTLSQYCTVKDICLFDQALSADFRLRSYVVSLLSEHTVLNYGDVSHAKRCLSVDSLRTAPSIDQFQYLRRRFIQVRGSFVINYNNVASDNIVCDTQQGIAMDDLLYEYPDITEVQLNFAFIESMMMMARIPCANEDINKLACFYIPDDTLEEKFALMIQRDYCPEKAKILEFSANELTKRLTFIGGLTSLQVRLPHAVLPYLKTWPHCSFRMNLVELSLELPYPTVTTSPTSSEWKAFFDAFGPIRSMESLRLKMKGLFWHESSFTQFIENNKGLKYISLSSLGRGPPIQARCIGAFSTLRSLHGVEIEQVSVTDATLIDIIAANQGIKELNLGMEEVTDASMEELAILTGLERLELWSANNISEIPLLRLIENNPHLKDLNLSFVPCITDMTLYAMIENTQMLQHISFAGNEQVSKRALLNLIHHFRGTLQKICLQDCSAVTEKIVFELEQNDIKQYCI